MSVITNDNNLILSNFIAIQNSHTVATEGYHQPYVRTGYEHILSNRTTDMFAYTAKEDGRVISKNNKGIIVEYKDGSKKGVTLGRVYGKSEGSVYPHDIVSPLSVNDEFKKGDTIAYNTGFFEPDVLDPKNIIYKTSLTVKVALLESNQTYEDSSAISYRLEDRLKTKTTKVKSIVVNFNQNLLDVVQPGSSIKPNDILMVIEDEITSVTSAFDEASLQALKKLSNQTPLSKYEGIVDKIEVFYHGDKNDMSASLRNLADKSDKMMADICRSSGKSIITGRVNNEYRVDGNPLILDRAEIKIYITIETNSGVGDKLIFGNQGKSVIGQVMEYDIIAEDGTPVDALFGNTGFAARIINSPMEIGTTISLLKHIAKKAVEMYEE